MTNDLTNRKIFLYGAGTQNLRLAYQMLDAAGIDILYIVDRDPQKQGKSFWGTKIISPEKLCAFDREQSNDYTIIITVRTETTIREIMQFAAQLHHAEVTTFEQFAIEKQLNSRFIKINMIQTHVTDHCNLNCARCSHLSPISEDYFLDEGEFEASARRLSELLGDELHEYQLAGGEPLLHPQCYSFPYIIRKYFPKTDIVIVTNGTLLKHADEKFFSSCRDNHVELWVTVYPIRLDYEQVRTKLKAEKVKHVIGNSGVEDGTIKEMWGSAYHLINDRHGQENFERCFSRCFMLRGRRMYICAQGAYSDILNKAFGTSLPQLEENSVDIFAVKDREELVRKIKQKIPFCDYCNSIHRQKSIPFTISKREITEWVDPASLTEEETKNFNKNTTRNGDELC